MSTRFVTPSFAAFSTSFLVLTSILPVETSLTGQEDIPISRILTVTSIVDAEKAAKETQILVFNGSTCELRWIVREAGEESFRLTWDFYRVIGTTVAPVETGAELGENLLALAGKPTELAKVIEFPESGRPTHYLGRLWLERGERRTMVAQIHFRGESPDLLEKVRGSTVLLSGFDEEPVWATALRKAGARIQGVDATELIGVGTWTGCLFVRSPGTLDDIVPRAKLASDQRLVLVREPEPLGDAPPVLQAFVVRRAGDGIALTLPAALLEDVDNEPSAALIMLRCLGEDVNLIP